LADTQQIAVIFLEEFFSLVGDVSPTGDEVKISVHFKNEVYKAYKTKLESAGVDDAKKAVSYQRFLQLWDYLFPYYVKRPHCDIPGLNYWLLMLK